MNTYAGVTTTGTTHPVYCHHENTAAHEGQWTCRDCGEWVEPHEFGTLRPLGS